MFLIHEQYARTVAAERIERAAGRRKRQPKATSPPVRRRAAFVAGRLASRLDAESARRAIA